MTTMDPCSGIGCSLCSPRDAAQHVFRKRERAKRKGKRPGERSKRRWYRMWKPSGVPNVKQIESRRVRARERTAMHHGEDLPPREPAWQRWDRWNWD